MLLSRWSSPQCPMGATTTYHQSTGEKHQTLGTNDRMNDSAWHSYSIHGASYCHCELHFCNAWFKGLQSLHGKRKGSGEEQGFGDQATLFQNLSLPFISWVTLSKFLNLSVSQFPCV